jgi:flagellar biosynthesis protein FlhB
VMIGVAALFVLLGVADLGFQKWKQLQELRMSKQDVRDEHRDLEGDPHQKARMRKLAAELGRTRKMMDEVKHATVVLRNPTHYAVALKYQRGKSQAPIIVAKGEDHLALSIIEIAKKHKVPVLERKQLARLLYQHGSVGREIPIELFQAVAEILAVIYRTRRAA